MRGRWSRRRVLAGAVLVPVLLVGALATWAAYAANQLPWQEEETPVPVTPFVGLAASPGAGTVVADAGEAPRGSPSPEATPAGGTVYEVVAEASEARYRVRETVGRLSLPTEAVGSTRAVRGQLVLDGEGRPVPAAGSAIELDLRTFRSDQDQRDSFVQSVTLADAPLATLTVTGVEGWAGPLAEGQPRAFRLLGDLTIGGITRPMAFETTATRAGERIAGTATASFTWDDFGLTAPNVAAQMISVEDTVTIEVDLTVAPAG